LSRFDRNTEVNVAVCVTKTSSKAATNPDSLNTVIRSALAGYITDQIGMGTML
jgi:hypothetical protein